MDKSIVPLLLEHLKRQSINGKTLTSLRSDPSLKRNETLASIRLLACWYARKMNFPFWEVHTLHPLKAICFCFFFFPCRFKQKFPYHYDRCLQPGCGNEVNNDYLGIVHPSPQELAEDSLACRTELYLCSRCNATSRFARFNNMRQVRQYRDNALR